MARSNGHNGQMPPQVHPQHPQDGVPHWRHPGDTAPLPQHAFAPPPLQPPHPGFAPSPDLPPFGQQPHDPYAQVAHAPGQPSLANYAPHPAGHQGQQPHHQWGAPQGAPAQNYDLGQFGHGAPLAHDPFAHPVTGQPTQHPGHQQHQHAPQPAWAQQPAYQDPNLPPPQAFAEPVTGQRGPLPYGQAAPAALARGAPANERAAPPQPAQDAYDDEYDDEELLEDEPKRGRKLMVVGALVGAICVGGGLAYAYKTFSGGKTPLINAQKAAPKAAAAPPAAPAKVAAKLPDAVPAQAVAAATATDDGVRRVQSIVIPPPGGTAVAPPQPAPPPSSAVMPGMVLDNMPRVPQPAPAPPPVATAPLRPSAPPQAAVAPPPVAQAKPPVAAPPKVAMVNPPAAPAAAPAAPAVVQAPERKVVPKKSPDAYNPNTAAAGGVAAAAPPAVANKSALGAGGAGYVATVLSTQKGRPEAMKAFADLQQKFPDVLGSKPAEVQEKDLGAEKGVWYRAVVGPPGSREAASSVCTQLKASGYGQCFVTAY